MTPPRPALEHFRQERVAEGDDGLAVEADLLGVAAAGRARGRGREVPKPALLTSRSTSTPSCLTFSGSDAASSARSQATTWASVGSSPASCSRRSARRATRTSVVAPRGELARELFADSRGCAGDEGCFRHGLTLFSFRRWKRLRQSARRSQPGRCEDRVRSWEAEYLWDLGDALVSGGAPGAGGRQPDAHAVPARSRPDRALEGVPAAEAQDAGVHRAGGRSLPDAADAHASRRAGSRGRLRGRWG